MWNKRERKEESRNAVRETIAEFRSSTTLSFDDRILAADLPSLFDVVRNDEKRYQLTSIQVLGSHAGDDEGAVIADIVKHSTTLEELALKTNHFTSKTFEQLKDALTQNTSVRALIVTPDATKRQYILDMFWYVARYGLPRSKYSYWSVWFQNPQLSGRAVIEMDYYSEMRKKVDKLPHPTMLELLVVAYGQRADLPVRRLIK